MQFVTVAEVARRLGRSTSGIRALCVAGCIVGARKMGRDWLIPWPVKRIPGKRGPDPDLEWVDRRDFKRSDILKAIKL